MSNAYNAFAKGVILLRATLFSCSFFASSEIRIISLLLILLGIFYMPFRHGIIKRQSCFCEYVKLKLYLKVNNEIIWLNNFDFREDITLFKMPYEYEFRNSDNRFLYVYSDMCLIISKLLFHVTLLVYNTTGIDCKVVMPYFPPTQKINFLQINNRLLILLKKCTYRI